MWIKKIISCLLVIMFLSMVTACKKEQITMIVPAGSPQLAQLYMQVNDDYHTTIVEGADPLVAAFGSASYDVIIAPTNLGAKLYDSKPEYQLAATITWGSYYLISNSNMDDMDQLEIVAFGQNQVPDAIMQYILTSLNIDFEINYLDSLSSVVSDYLLDGSKVYLMSEPSFSLVLNNESELDIFDLQASYETLTGYEDYPQASVFVHQSLSDQMVKTIKDDFEDSIFMLNDDKESSADLAIELGMHMDKEIIIKSIPRSHIEFKDSLDIKGDIIFFLGILKGFNPNFLGENLPDDTFYR